MVIKLNLLQPKVQGRLEKKRARTDHDRLYRREALLKAAFQLFEENGFAKVKISDVAEEAGLAKGTVFIYYPTKEALFLDLLEALLGHWFNDLNKSFEASRVRWSTTRLSQALSRSLEKQGALLCLLGLLSPVLLPNSGDEHARRFKLSLATHLEQTGALLEKRLAFLRPGAGATLFLRIHAIIVGLSQSPLEIDLKNELELSVEALLDGSAR